MDWNAFFKSVKDNTSQVAHTVVTPPPKPKWFDPRGWGIGEWGSVASFVGLGLAVSELRKKKK